MPTIKENIQQKLYDSLTFFKEKNSSLSRQSIWHGLKIEHAAEYLQQGFMLPHTKQRYWSDGKRRKENEPDYEDSFWMYGWSMTRNKDYAFGWSHLIFEFDADKISHQFKIEQLAWNNLFVKKSYSKKEFEEYVIAHYEPRTIQNIKDAFIKRGDELDILYDKLYLEKNPIEKEKIQHLIDTKDKKNISWMEDWDLPRGKTLNLNKCLKGIYLNEYIFNLFKTNEYHAKALEIIINHPLYKGLYQDPIDKKQLRKRI